MNLTTLNMLEQKQFTAALAGIFEHSAWVAEKSWKKRPFADVNALHKAMVEEVAGAGLDAQLTLLQAHPELAGKEAQNGDLTSASKAEQAGAKLDNLSSAEMININRLNREYINKFDFPFIIAVRNHSKDDIFSEFKRRLDNEIDTERATALEQVSFIALFRLDDIF